MRALVGDGVDRTLDEHHGPIALAISAMPEVVRIPEDAGGRAETPAVEGAAHDA